MGYTLLILQPFVHNSLKFIFLFLIYPFSKLSMSLQGRTCVFLISDPKHWQSKYSNVSGMNKLVAGASGHIFRTSWDFQLLWRKCLWKRFPGFSSHQALGFLPLFSLPCGHWVIPCSVFHCAQIFMVFLRDIWDTCHLLSVKMVLHLKSDHWKESAGEKGATRCLGSLGY